MSSQRVRAGLVPAKAPVSESCDCTPSGAAHVGSVPRRTRDGSGASLLGVARQPKLHSMVPSEVSPTKASAAVPPALMRLVDRNPTELDDVIDER